MYLRVADGQSKGFAGRKIEMTLHRTEASHDGPCMPRTGFCIVDNYKSCNKGATCLDFHFK